MKTKYFILLGIFSFITISLGGLSVKAEEASTSTVEQIEESEEAEYQIIDMGSATNMEEYTENENENDGLNVTENYEPINVDATKVTTSSPKSPLITTMTAGKWDYITSDTIKNGNSKIVSSYGGDFQFEIFQPDIGPGFQWLYQVYEDDGKLGDDYVGKYLLKNTSKVQEITLNARGYIDGDNNKAEFYIKKMTVPTRSVTVLFYD